MELIGCRSILISTRNGPMWRSGSVLRLQFWFACKSKSSTLFLTLPSGSIQECSRFINKSGITMIWSILPHRSFDQSKCMYMHQNRTVGDILRTENFLITLYNKKCRKFSGQMLSEICCGCFLEKGFIQFQNSPHLAWCIILYLLRFARRAAYRALNGG